MFARLGKKYLSCTTKQINCHCTLCYQRYNPFFKNKNYFGSVVYRCFIQKHLRKVVKHSQKVLGIKKAVVRVFSFSTPLMVSSLVLGKDDVCSRHYRLKNSKVFSLISKKIKMLKIKTKTVKTPQIKELITITHS